MNLEYLNTYLILIKVGSFSETAKQLYMSQPAISAQIKKLEQELGIRLVERGKRGISMTYAGRVLYNFAEYVNHEYSYTLRDIERIRKKTSDELTIISSPVAGEYILPRILFEFRERHALTDVNLVISSDSLRVVEDVKNGIYDIGFCSAMDESPEVEYFRIIEDDIVLILYPGHPLANRKEISLFELSGESIILREPPGVKVGDTKLLIQSGLDLNQFKLRFIMGTMAGVLSAVESRVGIAFLPSIVAKKSEVLGLIKILKIKELTLKRTFYYVCRKGIEKSQLVKDFMDFIKTSSPFKS